MLQKNAFKWWGIIAKLHPKETWIVLVGKKWANPSFDIDNETI